jgi:hypothetical protein
MVDPTEGGQPHIAEPEVEEENDHNEDSEDDGEEELTPAALRKLSEMEILIRAVASLTNEKRRVDFSNVNKQLASNPKLTMENWHSWNQTFRMLVKSKHQSLKYLSGELSKGHPNYNRKVDEALAQAIITSCDKESIRGVGHLVMRGPNDEEWDAGTLYQMLERELTMHDRYVASQIRTDLSSLAVRGTDVKGYIQEIDALAAKGLAVGTLIDDGTKLTLLMGATRRIYTFERTIHALKANGNLSSYRTVAEALIADQDDIERRSQNRITSPQHARVAVEGQHPEGYWKGRRDSRYPDRPASCYNCGKVGHIAKVCKSPKKKNDDTTPSDDKP